MLLRPRIPGLLTLATLAALSAGCPEVAELDDDTTTDDDDTTADDDATADDDTEPSTDTDGDGWTVEDGDCDDSDATVYPGAEEICDGLDNDCDGYTPMDERDGDFDGWSPCDGDCDDERYEVNPDATEVCGDGLDNDCDGTPNDCVLEGEFGVDEGPTKLTGEQYEDMAGVSPTVVQDVTGDGVPDLLVSAGFANVGYEDSGAAYVWSGPTTPGTASLGDAFARIAGLVTGHNLLSSSSMGDLDGDGYGDFLLSAPSGPSGGGETYLFHGPIPAGDSTAADADTTWLGEADGDMAFKLPSTPGDIDGDGTDDLVIGAIGEDTGGEYAGAFYVIHGPSPAGSHSLAEADVKVLGSAGVQAGLDVDIAGDLDGDGIDDILIGAKNGETAVHEDYAVFVWYGPIGTDSTDLLSADGRLEGPANTNFGHNTAPIGDTDGDGLDEFITCLYQDGVCYLVRQPVHGVGPVEDAADVVFLAGDDSMMLHPAGVGDVNGDTVVDYFFAAPWTGVPFPHCGASALFYGPVSGTLDADDADVRIHGTEDTHYAYSAAIGDLNGDQLADLLIGARGDNEAAEDAGALFMFYGGGL